MSRKALKPSERLNWLVTAGAVLAAGAVFIQAIAPDLAQVFPGFGPAHQRVFLAVGVLLSAIGSVLSQRSGKAHAEDVREEAGLGLADEILEDELP
jgi:uncharacterized membrane protein YidH (DUF202 family)